MLSDVDAAAVSNPREVNDIKSGLDVVDKCELVVA